MSQNKEKNSLYYKYAYFNLSDSLTWDYLDLEIQMQDMSFSYIELNISLERRGEWDSNS